MKITLKDIIDLDYLAGQDEALESEADIRSRQKKDRDIYRLCRETARTDKDLLFSWLTFRRQEETGLLPGSVFSFFYSVALYIMVVSGMVAGLSLAWSFLAYHGTRPVNVTLFVFIFIVIQGVLILITIYLLAKRQIISRDRSFSGSTVHTLLSALFFKVVPGLLGKAGRPVFKKARDTLDYISVLIRMKSREYQELFFWPFFILTAVFAFCFTTGTLAGIFFRVIVSDMAFGWQSTLMTTSTRIHDLVSFMALPWSWFLPETIAHPSLEQIEGSRIILKDKISVLATHDLVSWWPFLCLGILVYAVIPRAIVMIAGILAQRRVLGQFNTDRPVFRQLMIRMQYRVLDIDGQESPGDRAGSHGTGVRGPEYEKSSQTRTVQEKNSRTLVLTPGTVYSDLIMDKILEMMKPTWGIEVKDIIRVCFDADQDAEAFSRISNGSPDQVVLVQESWQPPIRGLMHYIRQLKSAMPKNSLLWILLTRDPGQENLCVDETDVDFEIWKKAVFKLEDPGIRVRRLV